MKLLLGIDKDPIAHAIAEQTLRAAAAGREPPVDIRQIQVHNSLSHDEGGQHLELRQCESVSRAIVLINNAEAISIRGTADECPVGCRGRLRTFLSC